MAQVRGGCLEMITRGCDVWTPETQQEICNALQSYDMKSDVQTVLMFTRGHLLVIVVCVVTEGRQKNQIT